ncbi:hypothetical protein A5647_13715 [Mycobacterium sp. 1100029.7]|nr:hypothetical protein A5647_13715 [Mycobacterium sp. 1100029.7]
MHTLRLAVAPIAAIASAVLSSIGAAQADPPPTQQITTVAVGSTGQAVNGYTETPSQGNVAVVDDCTASPSAVAENVYACAPSAAGAATCWPSTPGSLLCVDNPWERRLHRVSYSGQLPPVQPSASPQPYALELDDGSHCLMRNGGAWGSRDDGYVGAYWCGNGSANPTVLCPPNTQKCVDNSGPVWTVKVGELGAPGAHFPPPQLHAVTSAWFAGDRIPG